MRDQWGMSNVLKVSLQTTIHSLHDRGWSQRRIARQLGISGETVGRYLLLARLANPAISTPGLEGGSEPTPAISTLGVEGTSESKSGHFDPPGQNRWAKEPVGRSFYLQATRHF